MGGASRSGKGRKQGAAKRKLPASVQATRRNHTPLIVVAVVLVAAVAIGIGALLARPGSNDAVTPTYTASASGAVVTVGTGPVVVDVYEDYLCPICQQFERTYGNEITQALNAGQITVHYHSIAILDSRTNPPGYSTRAANAALCSVPAGIYPAYHAKLYAEQPNEGSSGLTNQQLIDTGTQLGAKGNFASCVNSGTNSAAVTAATTAAEADPALQTDGAFGTPTVAIGGTKVDVSNPNWLQDAIAAGGH
jgi:protein-disulfide isomerase